MRSGVYEPIPPDAAGAIVSQELGIRFVLENGSLAMFDVATGERLLSQEELAEQQAHRAEHAERRARDAERRLDEEATARRTLEAELARLRELARKINGTRRKNGK